MTFKGKRFYIKQLISKNVGTLHYQQVAVFHLCAIKTVEGTIVVVQTEEEKEVEEEEEEGSKEQENKNSWFSFTVMGAVTDGEEKRVLNV